MKKFAMTLAVLASMTGMAHAQMGPAGPPGGGVVSSNGTLRFWEGQTEVSALPVGRGATMVYTPSPGYFGWIDYVRVYSSGYAFSPPWAIPVDFVLNGGTNGTYQPADPMTIAVVADAYLFNGNIVDSAPTTKVFKWNPINDISIGQVFTNYPAQTGSDIGLTFYMLDTDTVKLPGPGARYRLNCTSVWKNSLGNAITAPQVQTDTSDRFGPTANLNFAIPASYNNYKTAAGPNVVKLEVTFELLYASTPGVAVTVQKTITHTLTFSFGGAINSHNFQLSDDAPLVQPYLDNN